MDSRDTSTMTQQRDEQSNRSTGAVVAETSGPAAGSLTRRALLRGAAIAAPSIVTIGSASAAVAMSSVRTYTSTEAAQPDGNYYCLAEDSTLGPSDTAGGDSLDIGGIQSPTVFRIPERDYRRGPNASHDRVSEVQMCRESALDGTNYYYQGRGGWPGVKVKRGILMSADAMGSLAVASLPLEDV